MLLFVHFPLPAHHFVMKQGKLNIKRKSGKCKINIIFCFRLSSSPINNFLWRSISISISISNTHPKEKINLKWLFGPKFLEITSVSHRMCLQSKHFSSRLNPESSETAIYEASPHFEFQIHFSGSQNSSITWSLRDKAVAFANGPICSI